MSRHKKARKKSNSSTRNRRTQWIRRLVDAATELYQRRLWLEVSNEQSFGIRVSGEEHPLVASIMGGGGEEYGLALYFGPTAVSTIRELIRSESAGVDLIERSSFLSFSMNPIQEIPAEFRHCLQDGRVQVPRGTLVPWILRKKPGCHARAPHDSELKLLLRATRAILAAADQDLLHPPSILSSPVMLCLTVSEDRADGLEINAERIRIPPESEDDSVEVGVVELPVGLEILHHSWFVAMLILPARIEEDPRTMHALVILDDEDSTIIRIGLVRSAERESAVREVVEAFEGDSRRRRGLPHTISFASRELLRALQEPLEKAGVRCRFDPDVSRAEDVVEDLFSQLAEADLDEGVVASEEPAIAHQAAKTPDSGLPSSDDLLAWKQAERVAIDRMVTTVHESDRWNDRALRRYFGLAPGEAQNLLRNLQGHGIEFAFTQWLFTDYRPTVRSKTLLEKILKKKLTEVEQHIFEQWAKATHSIFRLENLQAGRTADLVNLFTGETTTVHDRGLSESAREDLCSALHLYRLGDWWFVSICGPPLSPLDVEQAMEMLEKKGMALTAEDARKKSHLFGHLWHWHHDHVLNRTAPQLRNTDDEELVWHTATFRIGDEGQLRSAFAARSDVHAGDRADQFHWIDVKQNLLLGELILIGDELLLETNSKERVARARVWLGRIPRVEFVTARAGAPDASSQQPVDDQLGPIDSTEIPDNIYQQIEALIAEKAMAWLDEPIPALRGRTPREVSTTEEGLQQVARMIRSWPRSQGPGGKLVDIPREKMMRELGIEG